MTGDGFSVDVQQLEALSKSWNAAVKQVEALPAKISSIESSVRQAAQQREFSEENGEEIDLSSIQAEGSNFTNFTRILNTAASQLKTLIGQLEQDAQLIQRCSIEYQIADDAAANGITNISSALSSDAPGSSQITSLLNSLSSDSGTALTAAQGLVTANAAPPPTATTGGTTTGGGSTTTAGTGTTSDAGPTGGSGTGSTGAAGATAPTSGTTSGATTTAGTTAAPTTAAPTTAAGTAPSAGTGTAGTTTTAGTTGTPSTTTTSTTSGTSTGASGTGKTSTGKTGTSTTKDSVANTTGGDWKTSGKWDSGTHGPTTGEGMKAKLPSYDKLPTARQQIMKNMVARVDKKVGYSQSASTNGYRDDSSGALSAAWGVAKPGLDTKQLTASSVSHPITKDELQPGDALVSSDHAVLFGGWANSTHTEYYALENDPSQGTIAHVVPYPNSPQTGKTNGDTYEAYAKNGVS